MIPYKKISVSLSRGSFPKQDFLGTSKIMSELIFACLNLISSLTRTQLTNSMRLLGLLGFLSLAEALPLGPGVPGRPQAFQSPSSRGLLQVDNTGLLFPANLRYSATGIDWSEMGLDTKQSNLLARFFSYGADASTLSNQDYILVAPGPLAFLLSSVLKSANTNPPHFGESCNDVELNDQSIALSPDFLKSIGAQEGLRITYQKVLILGFANLFAQAPEFQSRPELLNWVISDPQLRGNFSGFLQALRNCSSTFIQPLPGLNYDDLLTYQLAAITTSTRTALASAMASNSSEALQTAWTSMLTSILSQPGTTAAVTALASVMASNSSKALQKALTS
ncbi:MAG: hypothetical protein EBZ47_08305, partial [Chlamydiae bacterium]|nr:hypothetical protein [Chlamydiota bacterium]